MCVRWRANVPDKPSYWSAMLEITWRRSARDSFLNAVSRLRNLATCVSLLFNGTASGRFDSDEGAVSRRCSDEWRACKMAPTRVILMSCGSYNPPTNMHLRMFGTYISICRHSHPNTYRAANIVASRCVIMHDVTAMRAACLSRLHESFLY